MTFKEAPVYNDSLESENRIINLDTVEEIKPHVNVPVDPGAVDTACCELRFHSSEAIVVLVDYDSMKEQVQGLVGVLDSLGSIS